MEILRYDSEFFDIASTLTCGQVFRYFPLKDGSFDLISVDKKCNLSYDGASVIIKSDDLDYFRKYFDLDFDYKKAVETLSIYEELNQPISRGKGIRILRQDLCETIFSFIISANNNIRRIQSIIEKLSRVYGTKMSSALGQYYAFPTVQQLRQATVAELKEIGLGYRAPYIYETARTVEDILGVLGEEINPEKVRKTLMTQKGIGAKVADCIMLFGLHLMQSYPVDTWIFKANRTDELDTPKKVHEYYVKRYGEYAGLAQQYIFHYNRNNAT